MIKSTILHVFSVIATLVVSLLLWNIIIGFAPSDPTTAPSVFNNESVFKQTVWTSASAVYSEQYSIYSDDNGKGYYNRINYMWDTLAAGSNYYDYVSPASTLVLENLTH